MKDDAKTLREFKALESEGVITQEEFEKKKKEILNSEGNESIRETKGSVENKNIFGWYWSVLNKYADFSGRARRAEYWSFTLVNILVGFCLALLEFSIVDSYYYEDSILVGIYSLIILIPTLALIVRRLHDTNNSGWLLLILIIPIIGPLVLLILALTDGTEGTNPYGADPKGRKSLKRA